MIKVRTHVFLKGYPFMHHVLACLDVGRPDNAASWMWKFIGETNGATQADYPDHTTFKETFDGIEYKTVGETQQGMNGDGI